MCRLPPSWHHSQGVARSDLLRIKATVDAALVEQFTADHKMSNRVTSALNAMSTACMGATEIPLAAGSENSYGVCWLRFMVLADLPATLPPCRCHNG